MVASVPKRNWESRMADLRSFQCLSIVIREPQAQWGVAKIACLPNISIQIGHPSVITLHQDKLSAFRLYIRQSAIYICASKQSLQMKKLKGS